MALRNRRRDADDAPEEETPRRSRRSREEEPEDEPRGRSRRSRDEEPEDDEPRGRRSRRSRDEDDPSEEDRPRRGRGRRSEAAEEKSSGRRSRGTAGFGAAKSKRVSGGGGDFADEFKPHEVKGSSLIKFVEPEPFDSYNQHWINEITDGKRSFCCHLDEDYFEDGDECPLCDIGDKPKSYALFNVVNMSLKNPALQVWKTSPQVTDLIERLTESKRSSPINREDLYFEVETTIKTRGNSKKYDTTIQIVKVDDVEPDFEMEPLTDKEIAEFAEEAWTDRTAVMKVETYDELAEVADSLD